MLLTEKYIMLLSAQEILYFIQILMNAFLKQQMYLYLVEK